MSAIPVAPLSPRLKAELTIASVAINVLMLALPLATLQIYDRVLTNPRSGTLAMLFLGVGMAILLEAWLRLLRGRLLQQLAQANERQRSARLVAQVLASWVGPASKLHSGEYVQALAAVARVRDYAAKQLIALGVDVPFVLLFLLLLCVIGGWLVVVPLLAVLLMVLLAVHWGLALRRAVDARNAADEQRYGFMLESLGGVHTLKALGIEARFIHRYRQLQLAAGQSNFAIARLNHALVSGGMMFSQAIVVLVVAAGAPMVMHGQLSMGGLIACVLISGRLIQPLQHALLCWMSYQEYQQGNAQIAVVEALPRQYFVWQVPGERAGALQCRQLGFRYSEDALPVLQQLDLTVRPGEVVAIGGAASSGRSTLLKIIAGMMAVQEGEVRVDGLDPAHMPPSILSQHVALLGAEPVLLRGTVMQNLSCFDPGLQDRAMEIAQLIGLDGLLAQLPAGYETMLDGGEAEVVPPGMRQRIAIARALAHKPRLILFDQADRSLDREGYHQIFRLIARLKGRASFVMVTDDQNLLRLCDRRYVLRQGKLTEQNIDARLLRVSGLGAL